MPGQPLAKTLAGLAKTQGKNPDDYTAYRSRTCQARFLVDEISTEVKVKWNKGVYQESTWLGSARASVIKLNGNNYAMAIQTVEPMTTPGVSAQQVVLLARDGTILDRLGCDINSRYGETRTEILEKPDCDGAQFVIHFVGQKGEGWGALFWHNWHTIVHDGNSYTFWADKIDGKWVPRLEDKPNVWNEKGLCRAKIANDKFEVIFPKLETPDK